MEIFHKGETATGKVRKRELCYKCAVFLSLFLSDRQDPNEAFLFVF